MNRDNFLNFIRSTVATYNVPAGGADMRVDTYGNFEIKFIPITGKFAKCPESGGLNFFDTDLHQYIKSINDVELNVNSKTIDMPGIQYAINRLMPMNSSSTFKMEWLNTRTPFIENVIVPWMQNNSIHGSFPLEKCDLEITFPESFSPNTNAGLKYKYFGIRPLECTLHKMTNEPVTEFYRTVSFDYDYFWVYPR